MEIDVKTVILKDYEVLKDKFKENPELRELLYERLKLWACSSDYIADYRNLNKIIYNYLDDTSYLFLLAIRKKNLIEILEFDQEDKTYFTKCHLMAGDKIAMSEDYWNNPMSIWNISIFKETIDSAQLNIVRNDGTSLFLSLNQNDLDYILKTLFKIRERIKTEDSESSEETLDSSDSEN